MLLVLTGSVTASFGQSYTIKVSQLDSLLWMAQKYRAADSALNSATASIQALRDANSHKDEVITLRGVEVENLRALIDNLRAQNLNQQELYILYKYDLKQKIRKRNKIIAGETGIIALLLLILLL